MPVENWVKVAVAATVGAAGAALVLARRGQRASGKAAQKPALFGNFIDGAEVEAGGAEVFPVVNPATGEAFATAPHSNEADVNAAVAAAKDAFPSWSAESVSARCDALKEAAAIIKAHKEELAQLLTREQGKPIHFARGEIDGSIALFDHAIQLANNLPVDVYKDTDKVRVEVHRRPIGVVACICPWNFPLFCSIQKWAPSLAFGNTVVVKPSPYTPLTMLAVARHLKHIFPPGVLNVVTGADGNAFNVGAALSNHSDIATVSFTGSGPTGGKIMASCAPSARGVVLELGGNDAAIVRADCDPREAAKGVFGGAFFNSGQVCCAIKRAYVHEDVFDDFKRAICEEAKAAVVGDGTATGVTHGPLNNEMQLNKVSDLVDDARRADGVQILCGGRRLTASEVTGGEADTNGFFYAPTIITGAKEGNRIVDEEQFGPVLPLMPYKDDDEAVRRANDSPYGLGGSVWSKDVDAANHLAARVRSGTVWVNQHGTLTGAPFGGFRQSGIGRELGKADVAAYTECQTLMLAK